MAIGRERYSYKAAIEGNAPDVPEPLMNSVQELDHWQIHWATSLRLLWRASLSEGVYEGANAWEYTKKITTSERQHHDFMRALIYRAKQDPRFWGVKDDSVERYCSRCRMVRPREDFSDGEFNCDPCKRTLDPKR